MNKHELIQWYSEEQQKWELLLAAIGQKRLGLPGVSGDWSMRDVIVHLTGWEIWLVSRLKAAKDGQPEPPPPWTDRLKTDDEVNAWIYDNYRLRGPREVVQDARDIHEEMLSLLRALPDDLRIELIESKFHVIWVNDKRHTIGEFFHHFYDDHMADVRAWLERLEAE